MYLTRSELRAWSKRHNRATIIAWLKERRIAYTLDADNWPTVARVVHDRLLGLAPGAAQAHHAEPDFKALEKSARRAANP